MFCGEFSTTLQCGPAGFIIPSIYDTNVYGIGSVNNGKLVTKYQSVYGYFYSAAGTNRLDALLMYYAQTPLVRFHNKSDRWSVSYSRRQEEMTLDVQKMPREIHLGALTSC